MIDIEEVVAPELPLTISSHKAFRVFLAGGISGCSDWQRDLVYNITHNWKVEDSMCDPKYPVVSLYNPRRREFDITDKSLTEEQIMWEYLNLEAANLVAFWFTSETVQPIVLYELGKALGSGKRVIIGMDTDYERYHDVITQASLAGYDGKFYDNINEFSDGIVRILEGRFV